MSCDVKKCDIPHEMQRLWGRIYLRNWKFIATEGDNTQQIRDPRAIMLKVSEHMQMLLTRKIIFSHSTRCILKTQLYEGQKKSFLSIL